jgi:hypothetical protein
MGESEEPVMLAFDAVHHSRPALYAQLSLYPAWLERVSRIRATRATRATRGTRVSLMTAARLARTQRPSYPAPTYIRLASPWGICPARTAITAWARTASRATVEVVTPIKPVPPLVM